MSKKIIKRTLLLSLAFVLTICTTAYCAYDPSTTRIKIDNSDAWTNINISDSYEECEALNSTSSTLGTAALKAHLTTDYDWNAMAIFSVSQYGSNKAITTTTSTTNNKSGIYDIGANRIQTTTILSNFTGTTGNFKKLYNADGSLKKYINKIDPTTGKEYNLNNEETGRIAISYLINGGTAGWLGSWDFRGTGTGLPVGIKTGLFGVGIGTGAGGAGTGYGASGAAYTTVTFRPVIWN